MESPPALWATCCSHPHSKGVSPHVEDESAVFQLVPIAFALLLGTTSQSLALLSVHPPFRYWETLMKFPRAFSFPGSAVCSPSAIPLMGDGPVPSSPYPALG